MRWSGLFCRIRRDPGQKVPVSILINILIFALFIVLSAVIESVFLLSFLTSEDRRQIMEEETYMTPRLITVSLYLTLVSIGLTFFYCCCAEKRRVRTMGLTA